MARASSSSRAQLIKAFLMWPLRAEVPGKLLRSNSSNEGSFGIGISSSDGTTDRSDESSVRERLRNLGKAPKAL